MTTTLFPPPSDLGAPARFDLWRPNQAAAVLATIDSPKRFVVSNLPTGAGKSLIYIIQALLSNSRTVILTSTKALQSQLLSDFAESGLIEIRGLNSYECVEGRQGGRFGDMRRDGYRADRGLPMACDEAPCHSGASCLKREGGCLYYDAYRRACNPQSSRLIVTNYAYWMSINQFGDGLGHFDLLVMDEAHNAVDELGGFIGTELYPHDLDSVLPGEGALLEQGADQLDWKQWGAFWSARIAAALDTIKASIKESERTGDARTGERLNYGALRRARDLRRLQHKVATIARMQDDWIIDWTQDSRGRQMVKFDPVWPGSYAESKLFLGIKKVVMVSATVRPKTAEMLGVKPQDLDFREWPSTFPKANRPIIYIPTARIDMRSKATSTRPMMVRIDQIIARHPATKGLIHTVSYARAQEIVRMSEHRARMVWHDSMNTRDVIEQFRRSREPLILVSPSITTGYDFAYDQARWQIIVKVPFPDSRDRVMKARCERDKEYRDYVTMLSLVQMTGRIVRAEDDWGETIVIDDHFAWFVGKNHRLAPKWFLESIRTEQVVPMTMRGPTRVRT